LKETAFRVSTRHKQMLLNNGNLVVYGLSYGTGNSTCPALSSPNATARPLRSVSASLGRGLGPWPFRRYWPQGDQGQRRQGAFYDLGRGVRFIGFGFGCSTRNGSGEGFDCVAASTTWTAIWLKSSFLSLLWRAGIPYFNT